VKINTKLMRKVARTIRDNPKLYDQKNYAMPTECGTAHCIAGWACKISNYTTHRFMKDGAKLLGLPSWKAYYLFGSDFVPIDCKSVYRELMKLSTEDGWRNLKHARRRAGVFSSHFDVYLNNRRDGLNHKKAMKAVFPNAH